MSRGNRALDITLAIKSRAKYAAMLTREDKRRICSLTSQDELVAYLARTRGWREATKALPVAAATDEQFSAALDQEVLGDFEALYRMASETSKMIMEAVMEVMMHPPSALNIVAMSSQAFTRRESR